MTRKLILAGLKERLKVYAGILVLYLLYAVLSIFSEPTARMDKFLDWVNWSYEVFGVKIYAMSFILLGMAAAALILAELIIFARDFYGPQAYLLFTLPVNGKQVVASRLGLFTLDFLFLVALDLPFRWSFYRDFLSSFRSGALGDIGSFWPSLTTSDLLYLGFLQVSTWILILTLVPLLAYMLIAAAKFLFDLSAGWLVAFVLLGAGALTGLGSALVSAMPPLVHLPLEATTYEANPFIPVLLLIANVLIFWSATVMIDRKLNV